MELLLSLGIYSTSKFSGPFALRPSHLRVPSILRPTIIDTTHIFTTNLPRLLQNCLQIKIIFYLTGGGLKKAGTTALTCHIK